MGQKSNFARVAKSSLLLPFLPLNHSKFPFLTLSGSPAEKADLEVADEILEINGQALENSSHTAVIAHIHNVS